MEKWRFCRKVSSSCTDLFFLLLCLPMFLFYFSSCDNEEGYLKGHGTVYLQLQADTTFAASGKTKATDGFDEFKNVSNYSVEISQGEKVVTSYEKYSDMPTSIDLESGTYQLKAFLGELLPAKFEAPYFAGTTKFQVEANKKTSASVTCALANTKVSVSYSEDFKEAYPDYSLSMTTAHTSEALVFKKGETRSAYFQADSTGQKLNMSMSLTSLENKKTTFTPSAITIKPREDVKLLFKTDGEAVSGVKLEIKIDGSTADTTVNVGIPDYMLPLDPPLITPEGFVSGEVLEVSSVDVGNYNVDIMASMFAGGTIDSCIVEINSSYLKTKGLKERYDLANLSEEDKAVLDGYFPVGAGMYRQRSYNLDLKQTLVKKLCEDTEAQGIHEFTFIVKDSLKMHQASKPVILKLKPVVPEIQMAMREGDTWSTHAVLRAQVISGNPKNVKFLIPNRKSGNTVLSWKFVTGTPTIDGQFVTLEYEGLTPDTQYQVKAIYGSSATSQLGTGVYEFATEPALQLSDNGFENWTRKTIRDEMNFGSFGLLITAIYGWYPCKEGDISNPYWSSTNNQTVFSKIPEDITDSNPLNSQSYVLQPSVEQAAESNSGSFAAKIMTVGWGHGIKTNEIVGTEYITPGKLYLGTDNGNTKGVEFTSRPTRLSFAYKYEPQNNEMFRARAVVMNGNTEIGYTELVSRTAQNDYVRTSVPFVYYDQYKGLKATHIYIEFESSTSGSKSYVEKRKDACIGTFYRFIGSTLYVDDVNLEY
ncbi:DUF4493 domain-containing protein [Parabacteroides distasonis]|uniref:DUF4493 domain-containing protein n=1 Tax=Parabacteroides distasonis TaxID=823 RepID=UPI00321B4435